MERGQRIREEDPFKSNVEKLLRYMEQHSGSTEVPQKYQEDKKLGTWVMNTRTAKKNGKLWIGHDDFLNSIGFVYSIRDREKISGIAPPIGI
ncbi:MAG: helicase associated domain-containing protein [Gloeomargaritales cyanobacterium]